MPIKNIGEAINYGSFEAGLSGLSSGSFIAFPLNLNSGRMEYSVNPNLGNFNNSLINAPTGQATIWVLPDPGVPVATILVSNGGGGQKIHGNLEIIDGNLFVDDGNIQVLIGDLLMSNGNVSLTSGNVSVTTGNVSVTTGNMEVHNGNILADSGFIQAGANGSSGYFICYPPTSASGSLILSPTDNSGNFDVEITNAAHAQNSICSIPDTGYPTSNFILSNSVNGQTILSATSSATPGNITSLTSTMTTTATTMTSGSLVALEGLSNCISASGGSIYGVQGKIIPTGTLSSTSLVSAVFGQFDLSGATITSGQLATIWGDMGTTATSGTYSGLRGIAMTNTTTAICHSQVYLYGGATNLFELVDNSGALGPTYFVNAGISVGSAGDPLHCNASKVLKITVDGTDYWLPLFASNS
jgi:hypothetical protein